MKIVIPLYPRFTALDVVGPYEMLARVPGAEVALAAEEPGPIVADTGSLALLADSAWSEHDGADAVVVPGGPGTAAALTSTLPAWLAAVRPPTTWMTSVCSGSLLLGAAGLLAGQPATSHYRVREMLREFGAVPTEERVVVDERTGTITAAGVSAGLDMGLRLAALLSTPTVAQAIQLWTEYDPQPPYDSGTPHRAPQEVQDLAAVLEAEARES